MCERWHKKQQLKAFNLMAFNGELNKLLPWYNCPLSCKYLSEISPVKWLHKSLNTVFEAIFRFYIFRLDG